VTYIRIDNPEALAQRLMAKVRREEDCLIWTGALVRGYPSISYQGRQVYAHHLAFLLNGGSLDSSVRLIGKCPSKACINPHHWSVRDKRWGSTKFRNGYDHGQFMRDLWASRSAEERHEITRPWVELQKERRERRKASADLAAIRRGMREA
jgi:hypothetical protein